ncbi:MAG: hypothetical protein AAFQ67_02680 [Pseudomonadota bacterium]
MTRPNRPQKRFDVPCTIIVKHTWDTLEAHVELDNGVQPGIGDKITVHGPPISIGFGESATLRRDATVRRAGALQKLWVRIQSYFELTELYEVSFSTGRL